MIRVALIELSLFLVPFALYAAYLALRRKGTFAWDKALLWPVFGLTTAGALLAIGFLVLFGEINSAPPDMRYVPPHMENGTYVPGTFKPREEP
jgi:hypothetical protein